MFHYFYVQHATDVEMISVGTPGQSQQFHGTQSAATKTLYAVFGYLAYDPSGSVNNCLVLLKNHLKFFLYRRFTSVGRSFCTQPHGKTF